MSFRKKTKPVIAASAVARSRHIKTNSKSEDRLSTESKQENVDNTFTPCEQDRPKANDENDADKVRDHGLKVAEDLQETSMGEEIIKPAETLQSLKVNRFKKVRLSCGLVRKSRTDQAGGSNSKLASSSELEESDQSNSRLIDDKDIDLETSDVNIAIDNEEKSTGEIQDSDCTDEHVIVLEILPTVNSEMQSNTGEQEIADDKVVNPTDNGLGCPSTSKEDLAGNGFIVTASRVSEIKPCLEKTEVKSIDSDNISRSSILCDQSAEKNTKNENSTNIVTPSNRFKRRKLTPCLSRAGKRPNLKNETLNAESMDNKEDMKASNDSHKGNVILNDKKDAIDSSDSSKICNKMVDESITSKTEKDDGIIHSEKEGVQIKERSEIEEDLSIPENLETGVCFNETGIGKSEVTTNHRTTIENNEAKVGSNLEGKTEPEAKGSRRVRFKPNVMSRNVRTKMKSLKKNKTIDDGNDDDDRIPDGASTDDKISQRNEEGHWVGKKHVRFNENGVDEGSAKILSDDPNCSLESKNVNAQDQGRTSVQNGSHSDAEDGLQSEGEGTHHHSRRKFTPCLGPQVRQRRRLSSMTLSEDEGHMSDKNSKDQGRTSELNSEKKETTDDKEQNEQKSEGTTAKRKLKRKRIVIKEPKEKMTMFDYIYYNPKSSEEKQEANGVEKKQQQSLHKDVTSNQGSEIVLGAINGEEPERETPESAAPENEDDDVGDVIAPQIKLNENGEIIIDEESLLLKTTRSKMSLETSEIVYTDDFDPYQRKQGRRKKKRWTMEETLEFYRVLSRIGTDFSFMKKFKTEEKYNGDLIDRALKNMLPMDQALIEDLKKANAEGQSKSSRNTNQSPAVDRSKEATISWKKNDTRKRGHTDELSDEQIALAREVGIAQEEIVAMEVAENVTI